MTLLAGLDFLAELLIDRQQLRGPRCDLFFERHGRRPRGQFGGLAGRDIGREECGSDDFAPDLDRTNTGLIPGAASMRAGGFRFVGRRLSGTKDLVETRAGHIVIGAVHVIPNGRPSRGIPNLARLQAVQEFHHPFVVHDGNEVRRVREKRPPLFFGVLQLGQPCLKLGEQIFIRCHGVTGDSQRVSLPLTSHQVPLSVGDVENLHPNRQ